MASVKLEHLVKRFPDGATAVAGVNLEVRHGEFLVLVGPSGCGKSTILRLIAGLEAATVGRVLIDDNDVAGLSPRERDVAMVFQNYALYPHLTVAENIAFPLQMRRVPAVDVRARVQRTTEALGIGDLLERKPVELSGGQRQRVALARAIVREPRVFLFDEPLSNLDAQVRAAARAELIQLHRELGATMVYVTHDQIEAMSMAQRVAVMREGRVEQCAPPLHVYRAPATLSTAQFLGSPPINLFAGRVEGHGARQEFVGLVRVGVSARPLESATLGVRPEDLVLDDTGPGIPVMVVLVEPLGSESIVHVRGEQTDTLTVRVRGLDPPPVGAQRQLRVDTHQVLVFDAAGALAGKGR